MLFNNFLEADDISKAEDVDGLQNKDPETEEGADNIAKEIETNIQTAALESLTYFDGGDQAIKEFCQSEEAQVLVESRKMSKKTFVRLGKNDDLQRRKNLSCLMLAKEHKDPLWSKWSIARIRERKLRNQIYQKYDNKATIVARKSQQQHIKNSRNLPALPKITLN